jgi:hypothetical protein
LIELGPIPSGGLPAAATGLRPRLTERHVLALGLAVSAAFVAAAAAAGAWTAIGGGSSWAALHLALAGAATVAIGAFMPHFAVSLAGTRPAPAAQRVAVLAALALGAAGAVMGVGLRLPGLVVTATALVVIGLAGVAIHSVAPARDPLARRHPVVGATYGLAIVELATGVVLGAMGAAGNDLVVGAWSTLRPAHAWLTLLGGISLTIAGTLVYLAPTILGARIRATPALGLMVGGMGAGPMLAAAGFALGSTPLVVVGMALTMVGAGGQMAYVADCRRRRGGFTSEHDWRRVAVGHLAAGTAWFAIATTVALGTMLNGRGLAGWSLGLLGLPLVAGWMLQALVGSWTHLVPSVTPGIPDDHARQRRVLATGARARLIAWNGGLLAAWWGAWLSMSAVAIAGGIVLLATVAASVALMVRALTIGRY